MRNDSTILNMPTTLDQLASKIKDDLERRHTSRAEWVEATLDLCCHLAEARAQFVDNQKFGHWLDFKGLGKDTLNPQNRAAAIEMGQNPMVARMVLETTERKSLQLIHREEFRPAVASKTETGVAEMRVSTASKTTKPQLPRGIGWATAVKNKIGDGKPHWQTINNNKAKAEELLGYEIPSKFREPEKAQAFAEDYVNLVMPKLWPSASTASPVATEALSPTKQQQFEAALRAAKRKQELEFDERVTKAAYAFLDETLLPRLKAREVEAERVIKGRKGIMSRVEYRKILGCLHPDVVTDPEKKPKYEEAFRIFHPLELVMCSEKEMPTKPSDLPRTVEELLARRKGKR